MIEVGTLHLNTDEAKAAAFDRFVEAFKKIYDASEAKIKEATNPFTLVNELGVHEALFDILSMAELVSKETIDKVRIPFVAETMFKSLMMTVDKKE